MTEILRVLPDSCNNKFREQLTAKDLDCEFISGKESFTILLCVIKQYYSNLEFSAKLHRSDKDMEVSKKKNATQPKVHSVQVNDSSSTGDSNQQQAPVQAVHYQNNAQQNNKKGNSNSYQGNQNAGNGNNSNKNND